jgi:hypothetical protein
MDDYDDIYDDFHDGLRNTVWTAQTLKEKVSIAGCDSYPGDKHTVSFVLKCTYTAEFDEKTASDDTTLCDWYLVVSIHGEREYFFTDVGRDPMCDIFALVKLQSDGSKIFGKELR